uniref:Uncharacterized protein n=1 Tax=Panagrolaimus sp. JU765 TaxID=591449 RepID=A0AC34R4N8_9BILA
MSVDKKKTDKEAMKAQEKIVNGFKELRAQQQDILSDLSLLEGDMRELWGVIKVMKTLPSDMRELWGVIKVMKTLPSERKVLRVVGDISLETTVEQDLKKKHLEFNERADAHRSLLKKLEEKAVEINDYQKEHSIRILNEDEIAELQKKNQIQFRS